MKKGYGKVKVKRVTPGLDEVPEDCGYDKRFKFDIDMNSNGIMGDCIEWCQINCKGKWGWWFEAKDNKPEYDNDTGLSMPHNWEEQNAYMSFEKKKDATRFWLAVGLANMGERDG